MNALPADLHSNTHVCRNEVTTGFYKISHYEIFVDSCHTNNCNSQFVIHGDIRL